MTYDVLIASFHREDLLAKCLNSILGSEAKNLQDIIVLSLESDTKTQELVNSHKNIKNILVTDIPKPGKSRNILISHSTAQYCFFLDDDAFLSHDYFPRAEEIIQEKKPDVFGGPDQSPKAASLNQKVLASLMESRFLMGPTFQRHKITKNNIGSEVNLTLCNLWVKRDIFTKDHILFDEDVSRCEENILIEQIESVNKELLYVSDLFVYHHRRENLLDILNIQYRSGFYRGICFYLDKRTFKGFFLIPIFTGLLILLTPFNPKILFLYGIYFLISTIISTQILLKFKSLRAFLYSMFLLPTIHFGFSIGILMGTCFGKIYGRQ